MHREQTHNIQPAHPKAQLLRQGQLEEASGLLKLPLKAFVADAVPADCTKSKVQSLSQPAPSDTLRWGMT